MNTDIASTVEVLPSTVYQGQSAHIFIRYSPHPLEDIVPITEAVLDPEPLCQQDGSTPRLDNQEPISQVASSEICVCCRVYPSTYVIPACSHLCLCDPCRATLLVSDYPRCPLCRANMTDRPLPPAEPKKEDKEEEKTISND